MNAIEYAKKFRRVAMASMIVVALMAVALVFLKIVPNSPYVPFIAIGVGLIPLAIFRRYNRPVCEKCSGPMKIKSGFPHLVYQCRACGEAVDTGIHSDY